MGLIRSRGGFLLPLLPVLLPALWCEARRIGDAGGDRAAVFFFLLGSAAWNYVVLDPRARLEGAAGARYWMIAPYDFSLETRREQFVPRMAQVAAVLPVVPKLGRVGADPRRIVPKRWAAGRVPGCAGSPFPKLRWVDSNCSCPTPGKDTR